MKAVRDRLLLTSMALLALSSLASCGGVSSNTTDTTAVATAVTTPGATTATTDATVVAPSAEVQARPEAPTSTLRGVDWCNRGYGDALPALSQCVGEREERDRPELGPHHAREYRLTAVAYGDLTGDGQEDALVLLEVVRRPILIQPTAPVPTAEVWLFQLRGTDLFLYTTETIADVPTRVSITQGTATLVRRRGAQECEETWRFVGEGQTAVVTPGRCRPTDAGNEPGR
jgi:hypothetical protein